MIAALYDLHGNLPAFEAVLDEITRERVQRIVVGGDVVPGPMAPELLDRLLALNVPVDFIYGNCETEVLRASRGEPLVRVPEAHRAVIEWSAQQFTPTQLETMARWPLTVRRAVDGIGEVLFCHATPRDDNEIFTRLTPIERLLPLFDPLGVSMVVCGHTHMQFDRTIGHTRVVNAGSVGMSFQGPGAYWLLLGPDVQLRRTEYDLEEAARRIGATDYPGAEEFAAKYVVTPPTEAQMLAVFETAAGKQVSK